VQFDWKVDIPHSFSILKILSINCKLAIVIIIIVAFHTLLYLSDYLRTN